MTLRESPHVQFTMLWYRVSPDVNDPATNPSQTPAVPPALHQPPRAGRPLALAHLRYPARERSL